MSSDFDHERYTLQRRQEDYGPADVALATSTPTINRSEALGYGKPSLKIVTITAFGDMVTPVMFFPTEGAALDYVGMNCGSEARFIESGEELDWKLLDGNFDVGPLTNALFERVYFGCGSPRRFAIEHLQLAIEHDGNGVWAVIRYPANEIMWTVEIAPSEAAADVQADHFRSSPHIESERGWACDIEDQEARSRDAPTSVIVERVEFGQRWYVWDMD
jgi:hypothetical protein